MRQRRYRSACPIALPIVALAENGGQPSVRLKKKKAKSK
jgi:hypothetical protein